MVFIIDKFNALNFPHILMPSIIKFIISGIIWETIYLYLYLYRYTSKGTHDYIRWLTSKILEVLQNNELEIIKLKRISTIVKVNYKNSYCKIAHQYKYLIKFSFDWIIK